MTGSVGFSTSLTMAMKKIDRFAGYFVFDGAAQTATLNFRGRHMSSPSTMIEGW